MFRGPDDAQEDLIPFRSNAESGQWFLDAVISTDPDTAKQVGEVVQQRFMRKQAVTPKVEASLCVENSRHRLADILEEK
jgi:hypothetical protein